MEEPIGQKIDRGKENNGQGQDAEGPGDPQVMKTIIWGRVTLAKSSARGQGVSQGLRITQLQLFNKI